MNIVLFFLISYIVSPGDAVTYSLAGLYPPQELHCEAIFINPALLLNSGRFSTTLTFKDFYFMKDFREITFSTGTVLKNTGLGAGISSKGIPGVYSENTYLLALAKEIFKIKVGLGARMIEIKAPEDNLTKRVFSVDYGLSYSYSIFTLSFSHLNVLSPDIAVVGSGEESNPLLSVQININKPSSVNWIYGYEKNGDREDFVIGSEMWFSKGFGVRIGLRERRIYMGLALKTPSWGINVSFGSHRELGTSYVISTFYVL